MNSSGVQPAAPQGVASPDIEQLRALDEGGFLLYLRNNHILDPLRSAVNSGHGQRFLMDLATVINHLRLRVSDLLSSLYVLRAGS